jgi:RNA polymerase sigma factor (TIGR02999 family)
MRHPDDITLLLRASRDDPDAAERLFDRVYDELRGVAGRQLLAEREGHTLEPTALAHEVYLRLLGQDQVDWQNRAHFFAIAARATRRVLVDHARARLRHKRGGGAPHTALPTEPGIAADAPATALVALDEALARLKEHDPVKCQVVEMRYFGGFGGEEIAASLGVSTRTVERHWRYAKAWLFRELGGAADLDRAP